MYTVVPDLCIMSYGLCYATYWVGGQLELLGVVRGTYYHDTQDQPHYQRI